MNVIGKLCQLRQTSRGCRYVTRETCDTGAHTPIIVEKQNYFANDMYVHLLHDVILSRIINTLINV